MCSKYCRLLYCIYWILSCYDFQIFPRTFCYKSGGSNRYWCNLTFQVLRLFYLYPKIIVFFFFPLPFARHFCLRILLRLSICMFYGLIIISDPFSVTCLSVCLHVYCLIPSHCNIFLFTHWIWRVCVCVCVYHLSVVSLHTYFHIE
jgi:hypothetical protein